MRRIIVGLVAVSFLAMSIEGAFARQKVYSPNYGFCKSGKKVRDVAKCKENGGRK